MPLTGTARRKSQQDAPESSTLPPVAGSEPARLDRKRLDAFTHARLWKNPCGFAARFNYIALRYNIPLYGWVEERFGLNRVEFVVIYSLAIHDGVTASDIASSTAFPKNTLSRAVNRLLKLGLIARKADDDDRRMQILTLLPAGRAIYDEALPRFANMEQEMLAPLNLVEREMLSLLLAKVVLATFGTEPSGQENPG
jgi:MarR family transcriptional regulator, temperature-dependent positive regulator of motility